MLLVVLIQPTEAHRSGYHRWHSCPSDTGSYVCGDWGYCSFCPDNEYCKSGLPVSRGVPPTISTTTTSLSQTTTTIASGPSCKGSAKCFSAKVTNIIDGDTLDADGTRIRLVLVDAPELSETGGSEATTFVKRFCPVGSEVTIDHDD